MAQFRRKPVVIEAVQWRPGVEIEGVTYFSGDRIAYLPVAGTDHVAPVCDGDWVVTHSDGGPKSVVSDANLRREYEPVDDPAWAPATEAR